MSDCSFIILGSSSGIPQAQRACSGYLLRTPDGLSLIDCGGGVTSSFLKQGFGPLDLDRIFISHTHPDHCCDLPLLVQMVYLAGRKEPFDIYVPEEFVDPLEKFLQAVYLIREKLPFDLNVIGYNDGFTFSDGFHLSVIANQHLRGYADLIDRLNLPNRMECYSLEINAGGKSLLYSADIGDLGDIEDHLNGHDLVILETTHFDLSRFFETAQTVGVGRFVLTHLGTPEEIHDIEQMILRSGADNVILAMDGMTLEL